MQWFPFAVLIEETDTVHAAVFFYEFLWCVLVFAAVWFLIRKREKRDGAVTLWYMLLYPAGHIVFSLIRQNGSYLFGDVRTAVIVDAVFIAFALSVLFIRYKNPLPQPEEPGVSDDVLNETDESATPADDGAPEPDEPEAPETEDETKETEQPEPQDADGGEEATGKEA
jgi:hypothetical protein